MNAEPAPGAAAVPDPDPTRPRYRPKYDPRSPDEETDGDTNPYGFADPPPAPRASPFAPSPGPPPEPVVELVTARRVVEGDDGPEYEEVADGPEGEAPPVRRAGNRAPGKRKKKRGPTGPLKPGDPGYDRLLHRDDPADEGHWHVPLMMCGVGFLLGLVAVFVTASQYHADAKMGFGKFALLLLAALTALQVAQFVCVTGVLMIFGGAVGIDYGPVQVALPRLAATVVLTEGVYAFTYSLLCPGLAILVSAATTYAALQALLRLDSRETILTLFALGSLSMLGVTAVGSALLKASM